MARLNEEFNLSFHEADSSIQIGFKENEAALSVGEIEEITSIPVQFEESTSRIPVNIADEEQIPAIFGDVVVINHGGSGDYYDKSQIDAFLNEKVDKIEGKGLSTNDLTDELVEEIHSGGGHQEIKLLFSSGIFTEEEAEILHQSPSNYITYLNQIYKLGYKSTNIYKYFSTTNNVNNLLSITVDWTTNAWQCETITNGILENHIQDNERHINSGERNFWNNKLNYESVLEERLILNKN